MRNVNVYTNYSVSQVVYLKEHVLTFLYLCSVMQKLLIGFLQVLKTFILLLKEAHLGFFAEKL